MAAVEAWLAIMFFLKTVLLHPMHVSQPLTQTLNTISAGFRNQNVGIRTFTLRFLTPPIHSVLSLWHLPVNCPTAPRLSVRHIPPSPSFKLSLFLHSCKQLSQSSWQAAALNCGYRVCYTKFDCSVASGFGAEVSKKTWSAMCCIVIVQTSLQLTVPCHWPSVGSDGL